MRSVAPMEVREDDLREDVDALILVGKYSQSLEASPVEFDHHFEQANSA
jgi:hypothetical protein